MLKDGIDEMALFSGTSLDREQLETGGSISVDDFAIFLSNGRKLTGNDALGLVLRKG